MKKELKNTLIAYVLEDNFHIVADRNKKVIKISEGGINYAPIKSFFKKYIRGSTLDKNSMKNFSAIPKKGEYLITSNFWGFFPQVTMFPVREINENFSNEQ